MQRCFILKEFTEEPFKILSSTLSWMKTTVSISKKNQEQGIMLYLTGKLWETDYYEVISTILIPPSSFTIAKSHYSVIWFCLRIVIQLYILMNVSDKIVFLHDTIVKFLMKNYYFTLFHKVWVIKQERGTFQSTRDKTYWL